MAHTFSSLTTHIIFGTKDRFPFLDAQIRPEMHAYLGGIVRNIQGTALIVGGAADHVHLLVRLKPTMAPAEVLEKIKSNSTRWMRAFGDMRSKFGWQKGYSAFTVSKSNIDRVVEYIASQEEHHRHVTFQEEYVRFLKEHGIEWDERYLFE
jgi:putative transposase